MPSFKTPREIDDDLIDDFFQPWSDAIHWVSCFQIARLCLAMFAVGNICAAVLDPAPWAIDTLLFFGITYWVITSWRSIGRAERASMGGRMLNPLRHEGLAPRIFILVLGVVFVWPNLGVNIVITGDLRNLILFIDWGAVLAAEYFMACTPKPKEPDHVVSPAFASP